MSDPIANVLFRHRHHLTNGRICPPCATQTATVLALIQTLQAEHDKAVQERDFSLEALPDLETHVKLFSPEDPCVDWCPPCLHQRLTQASARLYELEHALDWHTSCTGCAKLLDSCYAETMRAETAETAITGLLQLCTSAQEQGKSELTTADIRQHLAAFAAKTDTPGNVDNSAI